MNLLIFEKEWSITDICVDWLQVLIHGNTIRGQQKMTWGREWEKADALISVGGAYSVKYGTILVDWLTGGGREGSELLILHADVIFGWPLVK